MSAVAILDTAERRPPSPVESGGRLVPPLPLSFTLDADHEAHRPIEARGGRRDDVHLLVSPGTGEPITTTFRSLPDHLEPGALAVVNTSATVAAALDVVIEGHGQAVLHVSTELPGDLWMVEPRRKIANGATEPLTLADRPTTVTLTTGRPLLHLLHPAPG